MSCGVVSVMGSRESKTSVMKTEVCITIDTEFSIAGAFASPQRFSPIGEEIVNCSADGRDEGLGFILETLARFGASATFFIETLQIFYFGDKYSRPMGAVVAGRDGEPVALEMGSYGIGVSRLVGALIEANHDDAGIIWPQSVAPFRLGLINLRPADKRCREAADDLDGKLLAAGLEVLYDDRDESPGAKFATMDLIGLPEQLVIGPRGIAAGTVEVKDRRSGERRDVSVEAALNRLTAPHPNPLPASGARGRSSATRLLRPRARERKAAHRADAHFAGYAVAGDLAGEFQRQRHRIGNRDFPGDVVALGGAVEDLGRIAVGALRARQRAAGVLYGQRRLALAHRRAHADVPVSVHGHLSLLVYSVAKPEWFWDRDRLGQWYSVSRRANPIVLNALEAAVRRSGAGGRAQPVLDQEAEGDILDREG